VTRRYASGTTVPVERSRAELERLLRRAGATAFASAWDEESGVARFIFRLGGRMVRLEVYQPSWDEFVESGAGRKRKRPDAEAAAEKEYMRRWRAQVLHVKAKLEMIADGMSSVEREFLADMLLPNGSTFAEEMLPRLAEAYETGDMDTSLPMLGPGKG